MTALIFQNQSEKGLIVALENISNPEGLLLTNRPNPKSSQNDDRGRCAVMFSQMVPVVYVIGPVAATCTGRTSVQRKSDLTSEPTS